MLPTIPHQLYAETAAVAQRLASHGFQREALFTLGESVKAARNEADLRGVKQFIVPCIWKLQHDFPKAPHVLGIQGLPGVAQVAPKSAANLLTVPWTLASIDPASSPEQLERVFHFAGHGLLQAGNIDGVPLLVEAARLSPEPREHLQLLAGDVHYLQPRSQQAIEPELTEMLASLADGFAQVQALPAATSIGLLALSGQSPDVRWDQLQKKSTESRMQTGRNEQFVQEITAKLDQLGYPAESSRTYPVAARIVEGDLQSWRPVWNAVAKEIGKPRHTALRSAVRKAYSGARISIGEVVDQVKDELLARTPPQRDRTVNAWLDGASLPLREGIEATIGIDISRRLRTTIAQRPLKDLDWQGREHLDLLITMTGHGAVVSPQRHPAKLPREEDMDPVYFGVTPLAVPRIRLFLTILLADTLDILEEFTVELPVEVALAEFALAGSP